MAKIRLDKLLVEKKLVESREKAIELIKSGNVEVNTKIIKKPSFKVEENANLKILKQFPYVSRAGLKLERALNIFIINLEGKTCLDIGASTGGFTECLLKHGAEKVYAVDVGKDQLHPSLRKNPKVISYEKTDARNLNENLIKEKIDIFVSDVSFISILKIIPHITKFFKNNFEGVVLIKPQFELSVKEVNKGLVKDKKLHQKAIDKVLKGLAENKIECINLDYSYPFGTEGNIEFLAHIKFGKSKISSNTIKNIVEKAHQKYQEEKDGSS